MMNRPKFHVHRCIGCALTGMLIMMLASSTAFGGGTIWFVNEGLTTGADDGTSWDDAFQGTDGLRAALIPATANDQIWVAAGRYEPDPGANRLASFLMENGVTILGGFAGGETSAEMRDFVANETILSGDLANNDGPPGVGIAENSLHVVSGNSTSSSAILDGFTISGGNANLGGDPNERGGGLLMINNSNPTVRNCRVINNRCVFGGGACYTRQSSPTWINCIFEDNIGGSFGGAFDCAQNCLPVYLNCVFRNNSANRAGGVEIFGNSSATLTNCLFEGNSCATTGGAMLIANGGLSRIINCTITNNTAGTQVGGIIGSAANYRVENSIVYGNSDPTFGMSETSQVAGGSPVVRFSCIQGLSVFAGSGNIGADPMLEADLSIPAGSPCIDAADNAVVTAGVIEDITGAPRFVDDPGTADTGSGAPPIVDMGAYEFQGAGGTPGDCDGDGDVDLVDFADFQLCFTGPGGSVSAGCECADFDGDGDVDLTDFGSFQLSFTGAL